MIDKILVAIDDFDTCQQVVDKAISLAKLTSATLMLVNVISPFDKQYCCSIYAYSDTIYPTFREEVEKEYLRQWKELQELRQYAIDLGIKTEFTLIFGDPGRTICEIAQDWSADLIITGFDEQSELNKLFLGSLSNYKRLRVYEVH